MTPRAHKHHPHQPETKGNRQATKPCRAKGCGLSGQHMVDATGMACVAYEGMAQAWGRHAEELGSRSSPVEDTGLARRKRRCWLGPAIERSTVPGGRRVVPTVPHVARTRTEPVLCDGTPLCNSARARVSPTHTHSQPRRPTAARWRGGLRRAKMGAATLSTPLAHRMCGTHAAACGGWDSVPPAVCCNMRAATRAPRTRHGRPGAQPSSCFRAIAHMAGGAAPGLVGHRSACEAGRRLVFRGSPL